MGFLESIQKLPLRTRKIILCWIVILIAIVLIFFWAKVFTKNLERFQKGNLMEELGIPSLKEKLEGEKGKLEENIPKPEIPEGFLESQIPGTETEY